MVLIKSGLQEVTAHALLEILREEILSDDLLSYHQRGHVAINAFSKLAQKLPELSEKVKARIEGVVIGIVSAAIWDATKSLYSEVTQDQTWSKADIEYLASKLQETQTPLNCIAPLEVHQSYSSNEDKSAQEIVFKTALTELIGAFGPLDRRTLVMRNALAGVYLSGAKFDLAQGAFLLNLNVIEKLGDQDLRLNAVALNNLAVVVAAQHRLNRSLSLLDRAVMLITTSPSSTKSDVEIINANLSVINEMLNQETI